VVALREQDPSDAIWRNVAEALALFVAYGAAVATLFRLVNPASGVDVALLAAAMVVLLFVVVEPAIRARITAVPEPRRASARSLAANLVRGAGVALAVILGLLYWASGAHTGTITLAVGLASGILGGVVLSLPLPGARVPVEPVHVAARCGALTAVMAVGLRLASSNPRLATLVVVIGITSVTLIVPRAARPNRSDLVQRPLPLLFTGLTLVGSEWLQARSPDAHTSAIALALVGALLDVLLLRFIRQEFGRLGQAELTESETANVLVSRSPGGLWVSIVGLGTPAILAVLTLFQAAAPGLGVDQGTAVEERSVVQLGLALGTGAILIGIGGALARPRRARHTPPLQSRLEMRQSSFIFAASGIALATAGPVVAIDSPIHYPVAGLIAGACFAAATTESLTANGARLRLIHLERPVWIVAIGCGGSFGATVFYFVTTGMWAGARPASVGSALTVALVGLGGLLAVVFAAAFWLDRGRRTTAALTPMHPLASQLMESLVQGVLVVMSVLVPVFAISRIDASGIEEAGSVAVANLAMFPTFVAAFVWVLGNGRRHVEFEANAPPPPWLATRYHGSQLAHLNDERVRQLRRHVAFQSAVSVVLLLAAGAWAGLEVV
jgi:hypothetical protein